MSTIGNRTYIWLSKCTCVQISNITKVCVQNVLHESVCSNARSKTWTPLPDRCTGVHRWTPGGNQAWLQLVNIMHPAAMLPPRLVVYRVQVRTVGWLQSWSNAAARSHAPCGQERCPVERQRIPQTGRSRDGWSNYISIILAVHLCTLINKEQVGTRTPQTAHSNRHHHWLRERRTGSH